MWIIVIVILIAIMSHSIIYTDLQELLVKPPDRVSFIAKFWLLTTVGDLSITYLAYRIPPLVYSQDNFVTSTIRHVKFAFA